MQEVNVILKYEQLFVFTVLLCDDAAATVERGLVPIFHQITFWMARPAVKYYCWFQLKDCWRRNLPKLFIQEKTHPLSVYSIKGPSKERYNNLSVFIKLVSVPCVCTIDMQEGGQHVPTSFQAGVHEVDPRCHQTLYRLQLSFLSVSMPVNSPLNPICSKRWEQQKRTTRKLKHWRKTVFSFGEALLVWPVPPEPLIEALLIWLTTSVHVVHVFNNGVLCACSVHHTETAR